MTKFPYTRGSPCWSESPRSNTTLSLVAQRVATDFRHRSHPVFHQGVYSHSAISTSDRTLWGPHFWGLVRSLLFTCAVYVLLKGAQRVFELRSSAPTVLVFLFWSFPPIFRHADFGRISFYFGFFADWFWRIFNTASTFSFSLAIAACDLVRLAYVLPLRSFSDFFQFSPSEQVHFFRYLLWKETAFLCAKKTRDSRGIQNLDLRGFLLFLSTSFQSDSVLSFAFLLRACHASNNASLFWKAWCLWSSWFQWVHRDVCWFRIIYFE